MQWFKSSSAFLPQILSSKGSKFPEKLRNWNILVICTSTVCVLDTYKVSRNSVQQFKRSCVYKKQDSLTDRPVKNIIPLATSLHRVKNELDMGIKMEHLTL